MREGWLLLAAWGCNALGLVWLAVSMEAHWRQLFEAAPLTAHLARTLRFSGVLALLLALVLCLRVDHVSMASLVWVLLVTAAALFVTFTLAWRPHWLRLFVPVASPPPMRRMNDERRLDE